MKLTFIGTGSAFTLGDNYHSNMFLQAENGERLLLDCGTDARHALYQLGLSYKDIPNVYISHLHADHAGGLEWLGFCRKFDEQCQSPNLFISDRLIEILWEHSLSGGMKSIHGTSCTLETYFKTHAIRDDNNYFDWCGIRFSLVGVQHVYDNLAPEPCYGLSYQINGRTIWWTADTLYNPEKNEEHYEKAELIFHDCETSSLHTSVHSHYSELKKLPKDIKSKMWLYHYNPGILPNAKQDGFRGFVKKGQVFDLLDKNTFSGV